MTAPVIGREDTADASDTVDQVVLLTVLRQVIAGDFAARMPLDGILVETDAPWLAPAPQRGQRNEPALVVQTARTLAELLKVSEAEIAAATTKNFNRLFQLHPGVGN